MYNSLVSVEFGSSVCGVEFTITDAISAILLLSIIPLLDLLFVPLFRSSYPSILKRLGFGVSLVFLSIITLFLMEAFGGHTEACMFNTGRGVGGSLEINVYWVILPLAFITLAEIFIYIPCEYRHTLIPFSKETSFGRVHKGGPIIVTCMVVRVIHEK